MPGPSSVRSEGSPIATTISRLTQPDRERTYDAYVGAPTLHQAAAHDPEATTTVILALLLVDEAGADSPDPRRLVVLGNVFAQHRGPLARSQVEALWPPRRHGDAVRAARDLAARALAVAAPDLTHSLERLGNPLTAHREERVFIRTLQLFEVAYAAIARRRGDEDDAGRTTLLTRAVPFFRILGTIPAPGFEPVAQALRAADIELRSPTLVRIADDSDRWRQHHATEAAVMRRLFGRTGTDPLPRVDAGPLLADPDGHGRR
jgi:hypothetical protein